MQRYPFVVVYNDAKWNLEKRFSDFSELDTLMEDTFKNNEDVTVCYPMLLNPLCTHTRPTTTHSSEHATSRRNPPLPFSSQLYHSCLSNPKYKFGFFLAYLYLC